METAIALPMIVLMFFLVIEIMLLVNSYVLAQYAAFAAVRAGIVSADVIVCDDHGTVSFKEGDLSGFDDDATDIATTIMSGLGVGFTPGFTEMTAEEQQDAHEAVRGKFVPRCSASASKLMATENGDKTDVLQVTVTFKHPILCGAFRVPGVGDSVTVQAAASLPLIRYKAAD